MTAHYNPAHWGSVTHEHVSDFIMSHLRYDRWKRERPTPLVELAAVFASRAVRVSVTAQGVCLAGRGLCALFIRSSRSHS